MRPSAWSWICTECRPTISTVVMSDVTRRTSHIGHHRAYVAHDRAYVARSTSQGVRLRAYTPFFRCSVVARRGGPSIEPHVVRRFARALETLPIINNCIYGFVVGSLSHHASAREHIDREK